MTDKPVVLANTKTMRTLADGSMSVTFEVAPEHCHSAFTLFGMPGTHVAIAAIELPADRRGLNMPSRPEPDDPTDAETPTDRTTFTKLPRKTQAGMRCNEPAFWRYLERRFQVGQIVDKDGAAHVVRWHCVVTSRRELDEKPGAGVLWDNLEAAYWADTHGMH